jgi:large repetitive protein
VVGGGAAVPGAELEYVVRVVNIAAVPALDVVITDDLDARNPASSPT